MTSSKKPTPAIIATPTPREETAPQSEDRVEVAAVSPQSWDGICLFLEEEPQAETQP